MSVDTLIAEFQREAAQLEKWLRGDRRPLPPYLAPGVAERVETRMYVLREVVDRLEALR
jgi:hypothetical protein